jgi:hypothetical protein
VCSSDLFKLGYGQDVIQEAYYVWHSNYDTVKFGAGLTPNTMEIVREGNDLIYFTVETIDTIAKGIKLQLNASPAVPALYGFYE